MRVLVTGVAGFVGSHLAARLMDGGHEVAGTYIRERPAATGVELFEADLLDRHALGAVIGSFRPDAVAHLAGLAHVGASWGRPARYFQINTLGTDNLLRAADGVTFVFASSAEVYGAVPEDEQPLEESRLPAPQSPYGLSKAAAELAVTRTGGVVARAFNIVGPGQSVDFALPAFAAQLAAIAAGRAEPVLAVGNLAARRDFLHVADAVDAYALLLERGEAGATYNLGSGEARSIGDMLDALIAASGLEVRVETDPERLRPVDVPLLLADAGRLRGLGWSPRRGVEAAVRELWESAQGS